MSIRTKIFFGCLSLALVTVLVGVLSQGAQMQLGRVALGIYDRGFMSMSYLRSAQTTLMMVSRDLAAGSAVPGNVAEQFQSALDDLTVAQQRAMSPQGEQGAGDLKTALSRLRDDLRQTRSIAGAQPD